MGLAILKLWLLLTGFFKPRIRELGEPMQHRFFVWPLDLDENLHMNNSRYLNYMELARWDLTIRSGFVNYALKHKIMAPVLNTAIVYRRSLGPFQRFDVHTRLAHRHPKSLFVEHAITRHGKLYAIAMMEIRAIQRGKTLATDDILSATGLTLTPLQAADETLLADNAALMKHLLHLGQSRFEQSGQPDQAA